MADHFRTQRASTVAAAPVVTFDAQNALPADPGQPVRSDRASGPPHAGNSSPRTTRRFRSTVAGDVNWNSPAVVGAERGEGKPKIAVLELQLRLDGLFSEPAGNPPLQRLQRAHAASATEVSGRPIAWPALDDLSGSNPGRAAVQLSINSGTRAIPIGSQGRRTHPTRRRSLLPEACASDKNNEIDSWATAS